MTMNHKDQAKRRFPKPARAPIPIAKAAPSPAAQESVGEAMAVEAMVVAPPAAEVSAAVVSVAAEAPPAAEVSAAVVSVAAEAPPASIDANVSPLQDLPLKAIDLWSDGASAFFDFARALGEAKTLGDLVEAQSRFASGRYATFMRGSNEFAVFAQACSFESGRWAPKGVVAAA